MDDPYMDLIEQQWPSISALYNEHAEHFPVMLVDIQEGEIHAFPYEDFRGLLDGPSQMNLAQQYRRAIDNRQMVLFVRDTSRKVIQSYSLALED